MASKIVWEAFEIFTRIFKLRCCDCALAHWIHVPRSASKEKVKIRFSRCERSTAANRRGWSEKKRRAFEKFLAIEK